MSESERPGEQPAGEPGPSPETTERPEATDAPETAEPVTEPPAEPVPTAAATAPRRLVRSRDDRVLAGVCGGLGEYLGVDAVLIRIAALVLIFAGGAGVILYVIGWIAMPEAPEGGEVAHAAPRPAAPGERTTGGIVIGALFVLIGIFFLLDEAFPDFLSWEWMWPIALIAVGAVVILRARR